LKTSNDLEIYTIDKPSKDKLEEICDIRQPVVFDYFNEDLMNNCSLKELDNKYGAFDLKVKEVGDNKDSMFLPLLMKETLELFKSEDKKYITENNNDFLEETCGIKHFKFNDYFLRPSFVARCIYDFMSGSDQAVTPLRYDLNYRNYYLVTDGEVDIKLVSPQYTKYLYEDKQYEHMEFLSPVNVWDIQERYVKDFNKVKVLDITLKKGSIVYIPAYWWYSIKYKGEHSSVCSFKYRTYMNIVAISPHILTHILQKQNIKLDMYEKLSMDDLLNNKKGEKEKVN
jgi:hypothetical protein